jgi:hypothetical protein
MGPLPQKTPQTEPLFDSCRGRQTLALATSIPAGATQIRTKVDEGYIPIYHINVWLWRKTSWNEARRSKES